MATNRLVVSGSEFDAGAQRNAHAEFPANPPPQ
jgi:hypothetical protein